MLIERVSQTYRETRARRHNHSAPVKVSHFPFYVVGLKLSDMSDGKWGAVYSQKNMLKVTLELEGLVTNENNMSSGLVVSGAEFLLSFFVLRPIISA